jgi:hypothetical protein
VRRASRLLGPRHRRQAGANNEGHSGLDARVERAVEKVCFALLGSLLDVMRADLRMQRLLRQSAADAQQRRRVVAILQWWQRAQQIDLNNIIQSYAATPSTTSW